MSSYFRIFSVVILLFQLTGCNMCKSNKQEVPTEEEKVEAIRETLKQGLNKAKNMLSSEKGFFNSDSLKFIFPEEVQSMVKNLKKLPMGNELVNDAITQINQVAESSIKTIAPVIDAAIDSMSVEEANRILLADSAAATAYLEKMSRAPLQAACEPIIMQSLDKVIYGDITIRNTWGTLADNYNKLADSNVGKVVDLKPVEVELDEFVTEKILDAVFYLMAKEEMNIRKHPGVRISKSMAKSFGWIDENK